MSLQTVLIANRGEIAGRIARACRALGLRALGVYSEADAGAAYLSEMDQTVALGPAELSESYLSLDRLMEAAALGGADALHPGYGFLSEKPELAARCEAEGLTFVGPSAEAITAMGDKAAAKRRMIEAGVPVVPGWQGDGDLDEALRAGQELGAPLLVKARAGGGGRGMRKVLDLAELPEALASAQQEAVSAFGDGGLLLERLVEGARHVEIQILADRHGRCLHLGERDCSAQRRHQKVIEEAPSPAVSPALRGEMGEAAVRAARAIGYEGAGTVEFLLDADGRFYFLEMNTRLQVEHPVTELVTGVDLVQSQLRIAMGLPLEWRQEDLRLEGHAIEARLYAERPSKGFLPSTGSIGLWRPALTEGVRIDGSLQDGQEVSSFYDPMLAKIIAWGRSRGEATRRLARALEDSCLLGVEDNRAYLVRLLRDGLWSDGSLNINTLERREDLLPEPESADALWALAAALLSTPSGAPISSWWSRGTPTWTLTLRHGEVEREARLQQHRDGSFRVQIDGGEVSKIQLTEEADGRVRLQLGPRGLGAWQHRAERDQLWLSAPGLGSGLFQRLRAGGSESEAQEPGLLRAPISGRVLQVEVETGQPVEPGQRLLVVEAMKMEHRVVADIYGLIRDLHLETGAQVQAGQILCRIEASQP